MHSIDRQVIDLWQKWTSGSTGRHRRYYAFYKSVVEQEATLKGLSLSQVMEILIDFEPLRPWPARAPASVALDARRENMGG